MVFAYTPTPSNKKFGGDKRQWSAGHVVCVVTNVFIVVVDAEITDFPSKVSPRKNMSKKNECEQEIVLYTHGH